MSADNWTTCPRCAAGWLARIAEMRTAAAEAYGTVPPEDFDAMRRAADEIEAAAPPQTFREDYEFYGVDEGVLHVRYGGSCQVCDLGVSHNADVPFYPEVPSQCR